MGEFSLGAHAIIIYDYHMDNDGTIMFDIFDPTIRALYENTYSLTYEHLIYSDGLINSSRAIYNSKCINTVAFRIGDYTAVIDYDSV